MMLSLLICLFRSLLTECTSAQTAFKIPKQAFFNFFHALEEGYHHKPCKFLLHS